MSNKYTSRRRLYGCWHNMKQRCKMEGCKSYKYYGARGISICEEWMVFDNFYKWAINNGYSDDLTIDRIDVNGGYCPQNCRWATASEQSANKRRPVHINKYGLCGVERLPSGNYRARITIMKKTISLGCYSTAQEAVSVREDFIRRNNL